MAVKTHLRAGNAALGLWLLAYRGHGSTVAPAVISIEG